MMAENQNVEQEETFIARLQQPRQPAITKQWLCKHVPSATEAEEIAGEEATIEELMQVVLPVQSTLRLYAGDQNGTAIIICRCGSALRDTFQTP
jgi:hypothetical protein